MEGVPPMRRASRVWDYLMRRKLLLLVLIMAAVSAILTCRQLVTSSPLSRAARLVEANPEPQYNNSLYLVIYGQNQQPSYSLSFEAEFARANVTVTNNPLAAEAYVRIFDEQGQLLAGEYTTMHDQAPPVVPPEDDVMQESAPSDITEVTYLLAEEDKSYTLALKPGYIIEVRTANGSFYSTLDRREASNFSPAKAQTETYVVMQNGLRRASWSEAEGEKQMYNLLRDYIVGIIEAYQSTISEEILNNKTLDIANKTRVMLAYYLLEISDQAPYTQFMEHLRRGGLPVIQYLGPTEYEQGSEVDLVKYLHVTDSEDGEIAASRVRINGEINPDKAGKYSLILTAMDNDGNETQLELEIEILSPAQPDPDPEPTPEEPKTEDPIVVAPIMPVRPPALEPGTPTKTPVGGIFDRPQQVATSESDNTVSDTDTVVPQPSNPTKVTPELPSENYQLPNTTMPTSNQKTVTAGDLALIGGGIVVFFGLIKFIFDHYVR